MTAFPSSDISAENFKEKEKNPQEAHSTGVATPGYKGE